MKIVASVGRTTWLAALLIAAAASPATAAQDSAEGPDRSQWRFIADLDTSGIMINTNMDDGPDETRLVTAYMVLATPHASGVDGMSTRYSVSCRTETITDLGGTMYQGATERGPSSPQNEGQPIQVQTGTVFGVIGDYACNGRLPRIGNRRLTGRASAIEYVRERLASD